MRAHRLLGDMAIDGAFRLAAKHTGRIDEHDRSRPGRADHGTTDRGLRIVKKSPDGVGKFTSLAAVLVVAPACETRYPAHFDTREYLAPIEVALEHTGHERFNRNAALSIGPVDHGLRPER